MKYTIKRKIEIFILPTVKRLRAILFVPLNVWINKTIFKLDELIETYSLYNKQGSSNFASRNEKLSHETNWLFFFVAKIIRFLDSKAVAGRYSTLLKKRLWHRCFPLNF